MAAAAPLPPKPQPATPESESGRHQTAHDPNGEDGDRRFVNVDRHKKKKRKSGREPLVPRERR